MSEPRVGLPQLRAGLSLDPQAVASGGSGWEGEKEGSERRGKAQKEEKQKGRGGGGEGDPRRGMKLMWDEGMDGRAREHSAAAGRGRERSRRGDLACL